MLTSIEIRYFKYSDLELLATYFQDLSSESKSRFGPHSFHKETIIELFKQPELYRLYIAFDINTNRIAAYSIVKFGWVHHEVPRLNSYGLTENPKTDCTFAPSVADSYQSNGIGSKMLQFIINDLANINIDRIFLWGGVQIDNEKAVNFYKKYAFNILGYFEYNGQNIDMFLHL
jgi:diamine N-acetyltransferase